ncbi:hypothetical protein KKF45_05710 [Patescibacteria group bacterium]|nr:hypothetical protein [Patescibacteria group bacterium]
MGDIREYIAAMTVTDPTEEQIEALIEARTCGEWEQALANMPPIPVVEERDVEQESYDLEPDLTDYGCTDIDWTTGWEKFDRRLLGGDHA